MSDQAQSRTVTPDALRSAADALFAAVRDDGQHSNVSADAAERARAEFWRLAFKWRDGPNGCGAPLDDYEAGMRIIAEVEARI